MYPNFEDIFNNYPRPLTNVKIGTESTPTNSWLQNCIANNIDPNNRIFNAIPWYYTMNYETGTVNIETGIDLGCNTMTIVQGNQLLIDGSVGGITVSEANTKTYDLVEISDLTAKFSSEKFTSIPARGSPFATFLYENGDVVIDFNSYNIVSVKDDFYTVKYSANSVSNYNKFGNTNTITTEAYVNYKDLSTHFTVEMQGTESNGSFAVKQMEINALGSLIQTNNQSYTSKLVTQGPYNPVVNSVTFNGTTITYLYNGITVVINVVFTFIKNGQSNLLVTVSNIQEKEKVFYIHGPTLTQNGNILTCSNYTGILQIADTTDNSIVQYEDSYLESATVISTSDNGSHVFSVQKVGNPLIYVTNVWKEYNITGMNTTNLDKISSLIYGTLTPYIITGNIGLNSNMVLPPLVDTTIAMNIGIAKQVIEDIKVKGATIPSTGQYQFGTYGGSIARLLLFAHANNLLTDPNVASVIDNMKKILISWIEGTTTFAANTSGCNGPYNYNTSDIFNILTEPYWKGIIVPADYLNMNSPCYYPSSNFGNSYYNDHHFHWGYLFYIIECMEYIGVSVISGRESKITQMLKDVVNTVSDSIATKTRHKDWYTGHSWATGFQPANISNPYSGPVQRQQESCSEAINCYYGAYLVAKRMNLQDIAHISAACLQSEIYAIQNYYYGIRNDYLYTLPAISMILNNSVQMTLDFGTVPDSYNGRAMTIYGIESLPFTEIAELQISSSFSNNVAIGNESYRVDSQLLTDLLQNFTYTPKPVINEVVLDKFDPKTQGQTWGLIALKILSFGSGITSTTCQNLYGASVMNSPTFVGEVGSEQSSQENRKGIVHASDSYTNTLYWLIKNKKMSNFHSNSIVISGSDTQCGPYSIPNYEELLLKSPYREQCLVKVPLLYASTCLRSSFIGTTTRKGSEVFTSELSISNTQPETIYYQVISTYKCKTTSCTDIRCVGIGATCKELKYLNLQTDLNPIVTINAPGVTYQEKSLSFPGTSAENLLGYSILRLGLARLLYGEFNLKYLLQSYTEQFFTDLANSKYCAFLEFFTSYPEYDKYFY